MRAIDLTGRVIGRWTVVRRLPNNPHGGTEWECRCECGTVKTVDGIVLRDGRSQSCGCRKLEGLVARSTKHGHSPMYGKLTPTYHSWASMVARCTNPDHKSWPDYGGRGIRVCERWLDFRNFLADMGEKPAGYRMSIDRYPNNDGNYEPGNCRWANDTLQARNKRNTRRIEFRGETLALADWADRLGIWPETLRQRLKFWPLERALTERDGKRAPQPRITPQLK